MSSYEILCDAIERYGNNRVAKMIGRSPAAVSLVRQRKYPNPKKILELAEETFQNLKLTEVACPELGLISRSVCVKYHGWAIENKVHQDRLYRTVKDVCINCNIGGVK